MASAGYNHEKLSALTPEDLDEVKGALLNVGRSYYKRIASFGHPYATKPDMDAWLRAQPPERLAKCLQNLAILGQSKAYLYWSSDGPE